MTIAFVFPGQGSQAVGMGRALAESSAAARDVFGEVDDALGRHLSKLMWEGPAEDLTLTENAQPALMAMSMAVLRTLEKEGGVVTSETARFVAGHSLGEYSALCAAGAINLGETARLLQTRGAAMQAAVPPGEGGMAALLGATFDQAETAVSAGAAHGVVEIANDNADGQIVISGAKAAVDAAVEAAKEAGVKRAMALQVSAPFHCALMEPAAAAMREALANASFRAPRPAVVANVTAEPVEAPEAIRDLLVRQVTGRVRWRESVLRMKADGVKTLVEIGAGKVLSGMTKRIDKEIAARAIETPEDVDAFLKDL